ncbi:phenoloxidase-activating enzyme-like [Maniola hyperantus]|uniref:phenoloxidase-activating enzyme-like n=1 Tax=Aphantopus hyperantus TaxID=2795564 RepID=UPI001568B168|nr:phenoloxidase-activating enzyme-like isoform X1 [Maniola hyperantus]
MEIAVKLCAFAVYLLYLLEIIEAQKPCKVPNGEAGTCILISKCQPLMDLYKKKYKTQHENMYFQQSYCGSPSGGKMKVCCPSPSVWNRFQATPVLYPHSSTNVISPTPITNSPVFTNSETPVTVLDPVPLSIPRPASEVLGTRMFSKEEEEINRVCGVDTSSSNKIVNGEAVGIDQYPWLALLQYPGEILACGGGLITHKFVLTAAHCLDGTYGPPLYVRLAEYNTSSFPTDYVEQEGGGMDNITVKIIEVKTTYRHPQFRRLEKIHDIGLIEMVTSVKTSDFIKAICLPDRNFMPVFEPSTNFTMAGWGSTGSGKSASEIKLEVSIPYVPWDKCEKVQGPDVMDTQICAGGADGKDSCDGDSGGPLMYEYSDRYYVIGVLSYGPRRCGEIGRPATHTNVYRYISWIKETIKWQN